MATRRFSRAGLERLRNLADLPDPDQAVTHILSGMKADTRMPFTRRNLDPLVRLSVNGFPDQGLDKLAGSAPQQTQIDPITTTVTTTVITPVITIQDTLKEVEDVQGGDPDLGGGWGPRASYYNLDQIDVLQPDVVFTGNPQAQEQLDTTGVNPWGRGDLTWNGQLHPALNGLLGGILYEGYLNTSWPESSRIEMTTNAYFILELDQLGTGTLNVLREFRTQNRTITVISGTSGSSQIILDAASVVKVFVGDQFITPAQSIPAGAQVTDINMMTGAVTLSATLTGNITAPTTESYVVTRTLPIEVKAVTTTLQVVPLSPALFRCQVWWSDSASLATQKMINIDIRGGSFTYKYLFPPDFKFTPASGLKQQYLSGVKLYGGQVGLPDSHTTYENLKTLSTITISYVPPLTLPTITFSATQTLNSNRLITTSNFNVMLGAHLFSAAPGFPSGCVVTSLRDGNAIVMSQVAQATASGITVRALPPQGFCTSFVGSGTNGTSTIQLPATTPVSSAWVTHLIFCDVTGIPQESVIQDVDPVLNTITLSQPLTATINVGTRFYVYYSSGLVDNSLKAFCPIPPSPPIPEGGPGYGYCTPNPTLYEPFDTAPTGLSTTSIMQLTTTGAVIRWRTLNVTLSDPEDPEDPDKLPLPRTDQIITHTHDFSTPTNTYKLLAVKLS